MSNPLADILKDYFQSDREAIVSWLRAPNLKLGGKTPSELLSEDQYLSVWRLCMLNFKGKIYERPSITKNTSEKE